jgi:hypothetical protein
MDTTDKRPLAAPGELASKEEEASSKLALLARRYKMARQSHQIRVWCGAGWIALVIECTDLDEDGCCIGGARQYQRVRDPDLAARIWRTLASTGTVTSAITREGRKTGKGIEYAVALAQRGLPVAFNPRPLEGAWYDPFKHEIDWADDTHQLGKNLPPTDSLPQYR